jgi:hypothetical protein
VAQGQKGTWDIWPYYLIHGGISMVAFAVFAAANHGRAVTSAPREEEGEIS